MPNGLATSFGLAVGLTGKPETFIRERLSSLRRAGDRELALQESRRKKEDEAFKEFRDDLTVDFSKYAPIFHTEIKQKVSQSLQRFKEEFEKGTLFQFAKSEEAISMTNDQNIFLAQRETESKTLKTESDLFLKNPEDFQSDPEILRILETKNIEAFRKMFPGVYNGGLTVSVLPDWFAGVSKLKPTTKGSKIERGEITITNKGAFEEGNLTQATDFFEKILTETQRQDAISEEGSKEAAIDRVSTNLNARAPRFFERAEEEVKPERKGFLFTTDKFNFTENKIDITRKAPTTLAGKMLELLIPKKLTDEIIITRDDKAELSFLNFTDPTDPEKLVSIQPFSFRKLKDGWFLFGIEKETGDEIHIEYDKVKAKFASKFEGATIKNILGEEAKFTNQREARLKDGTIITIGLKEGKWFNIETGKPIK